MINSNNIKDIRHKDFLGNLIDIGDEVIFAQIQGRATIAMNKATVVKMTNCFIYLAGHHFRTTKKKMYPEKCYVIKKMQDKILDKILPIEEKENKIEFISYDGSFPNLCSGILTFKLNGKIYSAHRALISGGHLDEDYQGVEGEWSVDNFGNFSNEEMELITDMVRENVPRGCCGGCG